MIAGGKATFYVSDMERAVRFYVETMGFKLASRHGDHWAEIDCGRGLILGLHPASPHAPKPGTAGAVSVGFDVEGSFSEQVKILENRGIVFHGVRENEHVKLAYFADPDGNPLYLGQ